MQLVAVGNIKNKNIMSDNNKPRRQLTPFATLSPAAFDIIWKVQDFFLNKSDVLILEDSKVINRIVPMANGRLVILNMNMQPTIKYNIIKNKYDQLNICGQEDLKEDRLLSICLYDYNKRSKAIKKLSDKVTINIDDKSGDYCFYDDKVDIDVPKLNASEIDDYKYEIDLFEIKQFYLEEIHDKDNDTATKEKKAAGEKSNQHLFIKNILRLFDRKKPIDILIKGDRIFAFEQDFKFMSVSENYLNNRFDADIILRSHNFHYFDKKHVIEYSYLRVVNNYDNEWWLIIGAGFCCKGDFNVTENLERVYF